MKGHTAENHVDDLRLPYLEGLLSPEEKADFEKHVQSCPGCASRLEETGRWSSVVKDNAQALCPDGWVLFEYAQSGADPRGMMSRHLTQCALCKADVESLRSSTVKQRIPGNLWDKMKQLSVASSARRAETSRFQWVREVLESLVDLFRPTVLVPVAVAAMAVFLVIFYPGAPAAPRVVALSSVAWGPESGALGLMSGEQTAAPLPGDGSKQALAIAILLTNFRHPIDQDRIDSFYRALEPPLSIRDRYAVVSPAVWRSAISEEQQRVTYNSALLQELRSKLGISQMLTVELIRNGETFSLRSRLVDTTTENIVRERDNRNLTEDELVSTLENISQSMLHN